MSIGAVAERFDVQTTRTADKDLRRLKRGEQQAENELLRLAENPYLGDPLTGSLRGVRSLHFSLPGSGEYRAAYVVLEADRVCLVFMVATRENFYKQAERRYQALRRLGAL